MLIAIPLYESNGTYRINKAYLDYIECAGYVPVPIYQTESENTLNLINKCDGLLLPGGADIEPTFYGMDNVTSICPDLKRDNFERFLYYHFKEQNKPILGICRGFQLIFLEEGLNEPNLRFYQHIKGHNQMDKHRLVNRDLPTHNVIYSKLLYNDKANPELDSITFVNSMHHQGVKIVKRKKVKFKDIIPLAFHKDVLEAFMVKGTNIFAVQWHPEELKDVNLLWRIFKEAGKKEVNR